MLVMFPPGMTILNEKPLGFPAWASSCLALAGSCGYRLATNGLYEAEVLGKGWVATWPRPSFTTRLTSSRSTAYSTAWRSRTSLKGDVGPRRNCIWRYAPVGCATTWTFLLDFGVASDPGSKRLMS